MNDEIATPSRGSFADDMVSTGGDEALDDEEMYYDYERRPSLDLGETPMDTMNWQYVDQALPPVESYQSMSSEDSGTESRFDRSSTGLKLDRTDSFSSCYSYDSDDCEKRVLKVMNREERAHSSETTKLVLDNNEFTHKCYDVAFTFKVLCDVLEMDDSFDLLLFKKSLGIHFPEFFSVSIQSMDLIDVVDKMLEVFSTKKSLRVTKAILTDLNKTNSIQKLQVKCYRNEVKYDLREFLKPIYGKSTNGEKEHVDEIFADMYMSGTRHVGPNVEHEVLNIAPLEPDLKKIIPFSWKHLLKFEKLKEFDCNVIEIRGVAGSGKSTLVKKLIFDWLENPSSTSFEYLFPISFQELKRLEGSKLSFLKMIHTLFPVAERLDHKDLSESKMLFIFDGLDEFEELGLVNINHVLPLYASYQEGTLQELVSNILKGQVAEDNLCLVTTRPTPLSCILWEKPQHNLELLGFAEPDKEDFFQKRLKNPALVGRVIDHIKSSKTLHVMCHLPLFCSMVADTCQEVFREKGAEAALPKSVTFFYTKLLLSLLRQHRKGRAPDWSPEEEREFVLNSGKTALAMLEKGKFQQARRVWEKEDVFVPALLNWTGVAMQFTVRVRSMFDEHHYCFIHPTMQEYLAALYTYLSYGTNEDVLESKPIKMAKLKVLLKSPKEKNVFRNAVEKSLQFEDGRFDMFLRFLCGMEVDTNQELLQTFCSPLPKKENHIQSTATFIRKKIKENHHPQRNDNLRKCLEELGVSVLE